MTGVEPLGPKRQHSECSVMLADLRGVTEGSSPQLEQQDNTPPSEYSTTSITSSKHDQTLGSTSSGRQGTQRSLKMRLQTGTRKARQTIQTAALIPLYLLPTSSNRFEK